MAIHRGVATTAVRGRIPPWEEAVMATRMRGAVRAPEFPAGMEWLNTAAPLSLAGLRGKIVLLDFWTYG